MRLTQCPQCGAPLPERAGRPSVACTFCGSTFEPTLAAPARPPVTRPARPSMGPALAVAVFFFVGLAAALVWFAVEAANPVASRRPLATFNGTPTLSPRPNLAPLGLQHSEPPRRQASVPPPPGGYAAMDPAANIAWALAIARGWQADVSLERVDVDRLRPDGTADLLNDPEAEVTYRFLSPGRVAEFRRQADVAAHPRGEYEFWVEAKKGGTEARALSASSLPPMPFGDPRAKARWAAGESFPVPPPPRIPPLGETLAAASRGSAWVRKPLYRAYLIYISGEGWDWYVSTLSQADEIPRVRASDGRLYPFSR